MQGGTRCPGEGSELHVEPEALPSPQARGSMNSLGVPLRPNPKLLPSRTHILRLPNGMLMAGCIHPGEAEGLGVFRDVEAENPQREYAGQYRRDTVHGVGVTTFVTGNIFLGQHFEGQREGVGVYRFKSGAYYAGEHKGDMRNGYGVCSPVSPAPAVPHLQATWL